MRPYTLGVTLFLFVLAFSGPVQAEGSPQIIEIQAKKFEYIPNEIHLKQGQPVILRLKTLDRKHGFKVPELNLEMVIKPGEVTEAKLTPQKAGRFPFHCSVFCGSGHENMTGVFVVE